MNHKALTLHRKRRTPQTLRRRSEIESDYNTLANLPQQYKKPQAWPATFLTLCKKAFLSTSYLKSLNNFYSNVIVTNPKEPDT